MEQTPANQADFQFSAGSASQQELRVLRFSGEEAISHPFAFEIQLISEDKDLALEPFIGEGARLSLMSLTGQRMVNGVIEQFEQLAVGRKFSLYRARLVPSLTPLRYRRTCRIFQKLSVPEIVQEVLKQAGFGMESLHLALSGSYGMRDYCVQYEESDWDFINRLLEEEGIFYWFEHSAQRDVWVLGDREGAIEPCPGASTVKFRDESLATVHQEEAFYRFQSMAGMASGRAALTDYRFKQPRVSMNVTREQGAFPELEHFEYPGEYVDPSIGQGLVRARIEELQTSSVGSVGMGTIRLLLPGYAFTLAEHRRSSFNRTYLVVRVKHRGNQPQSLLEEEGLQQEPSVSYQAEVQSHPLSQPYRPARRTARPRIPGIHPAMVVGPPGEEIYVDSFGRVKVQFKWDRAGQNNEQSSCWIRVNQPWAGTTFGAIFIPRIGQEVLVQFVEGDPDRPVIMGRAYNGDNLVPYGLPAKKDVSTIKTRSTPGGNGFNELRFTDTAGAEEIFLHAQRDYNGVVLHDQTLRVDHNRTKNIGVDQAETVGHNKSIQVGAHHQEQIKQNMTLQVGQNRTMSIGIDLKETVGGNHDEQVKKDYSLKARNISITAEETIVITVGKSKIAMNKDGVIVIEGKDITQAATHNIKAKAKLINQN